MTPWLLNLAKFCKHPADETKRHKVAHILDKLITLTIEEVEMYPSIQAKIWGNIGQVSELIDLVLDSFIKRSVTGGLGSAQAEIMAETAVSLSAANVALVARKVIWRLCRVIDKTCISPTTSLEQHIMWDDIANLARYLLMLSFNNSLDVIRHLPYLFHIVSCLVCTGPVSMRASTHGLVINIIHSLCTCTKPALSEECKRLLRLNLDEFSLPKFYLLFGISKVQSAATTAFRSTTRTQSERFSGAADRSFAMSPPDREPLSLDSLADITEALLEIMELCSSCVPSCNWLLQWTALARSFAFRYNPALQPRGLVVFGCIAKSITDTDIKQLLRHLVKALESFSDITLIEAIVMCLTRLQPLLRKESPIHKALFWVAISILQLDESSLYASGLAFLEQNLHTLESHGTFDNDSIETVMMTTREALEWYFKQQDHSVGLSFKSNFHFALVGHLIKGFRHPSASTVTRTTRVLYSLLDVVGKSSVRAGQDKYVVTKSNVAYLAALVSVSDEVRSRCHVKHIITNLIPDSPTFDSFAVDHHLKTGGMKRPNSGLASPMTDSGGYGGQHGPPHSAPPAANQHRQKSLEGMDHDGQPQRMMLQKPQFSRSNLRSNSAPMDPSPTPPGGPDPDEHNQPRNKILGGAREPGADPNAEAVAAATRPSITNDSNILLDPDVLDDQVTQVLVLTVMATLGTIHILRKHLYSTKINFITKFFIKTGFFRQNKGTSVFNITF